ncbi:MAG: substrate-binding domain-containing protein, partial [Deltaproteobacteria bacterium]|nr:substrate-binding domain-containing protein [Deltaproteobacteria bacterium]
TCQTLPRVVRDGSTAGVIFITETHPDMVRDIERRGIPVVLVDYYPHMANVNSVEIDNFRGGQLPVEHLVSLGHTRLAYVYANAERPSIRGRVDGFVSAIKEAGLSFSPQRQLWECDAFTFYAARDLAMEKLRIKNRPTAIACANDELAGGVLRAAQRLNIKVPDELSVVGFDNITMGYYTEPALTTVGGDKEGLGARAVRRLVSAVHERDRSNVHLEVLPVELIVRGSTGPAPH